MAVTKIKVSITKIKKYTYTGVIQDFINEGTAVEGDYFVEWDDDIPMPMIENAFVVETGIEIDLDTLDLESMEHDLFNSGEDSNWTEDRLGSLIDDAYDSTREN